MVSFMGCPMVVPQASASPMLFFPSRELGYFSLLCFRLFNCYDLTVRNVGTSEIIFWYSKGFLPCHFFMDKI